ASADAAGSFSGIDFLVSSAVDAAPGDADGGLECDTSEAKVLNEEATLIAALKALRPQKALSPAKAPTRRKHRSERKHDRPTSGACRRSCGRPTSRSGPKGRSSRDRPARDTCHALPDGRRGSAG